METSVKVTKQDYIDYENRVKAIGLIEESLASGIKPMKGGQSQYDSAECVPNKDPNKLPTHAYLNNKDIRKKENELISLRKRTKEFEERIK